MRSHAVKNHKASGTVAGGSKDRKFVQAVPRSISKQ